MTDWQNEEQNQRIALKNSSQLAGCNDRRLMTVMLMLIGDVDGYGSRIRVR